MTFIPAKLLRFISLPICSVLPSPTGPCACEEVQGSLTSSSYCERGCKGTRCYPTDHADALAWGEQEAQGRFHPPRALSSPL